MPFDHLKNYVASKYPHLQEHITDAQYEQIDWTVNTSLEYQTSGAALVQLDNPRFYQAKRLLARLHFLSLLRQGDYSTFVGAENNQEPPIDPENFGAISEIIQELTAEEYQQLWVASTTSISDPAKTLAVGKISLTALEDSVEFLAETMTVLPEIYPAAKELMKEDPTAKAAFNAMFNTGHFRHMMSVEGDEKMHGKLREKIMIKEFDQRSLNLWFAYWLIDIAAFDLHTQDGLGSKRLRNDTAKTVLFLKSQLNELLTNPNKPILKEYLEQRAQWITSGISDISFLSSTPSSHAIPRMVMARIAALCRVYTPQSGAEIYHGLRRIKETYGDEKFDSMMLTLDALKRRDEPTPTYGPALLSNLYKKTGNYATAVSLGLPLISEALEKYRALSAALREKCILNLNDLGKASNLEKIIAGEKLEVNIGQNGKACLNPITHDLTLSQTPALDKK